MRFRSLDEGFKIIYSPCARACAIGILVRVVEFIQLFLSFQHQKVREYCADRSNFAALPIPNVRFSQTTPTFHKIVGERASVGWRKERPNVPQLFVDFVILK